MKNDFLRIIKLLGILSGLAEISRYNVGCQKRKEARQWHR